MNERDRKILLKILQYIDEIQFTIKELNLEETAFKENTIAKNAIAMCILQIGELVGHLSEELKEKYQEMPWTAIKAMRNVAAHNYGAMDLDLLWETATGDVIALKNYCKKILQEL